MASLDMLGFIRRTPPCRESYESFIPHRGCGYVGKKRGSTKTPQLWGDEAHFCPGMSGRKLSNWGRTERAALETTKSLNGWRRGGSIRWGGHSSTSTLAGHTLDSKSIC